MFDKTNSVSSLGCGSKKPFLSSKLVSTRWEEEEEDAAKKTGLKAAAAAAAAAAVVVHISPLYGLPPSPIPNSDCYFLTSKKEGSRM